MSLDQVEERLQQIEKEFKTLKIAMDEMQKGHRSEVAFLPFSEDGYLVKKEEVSVQLEIQNSTPDFSPVVALNTSKNTSLALTIDQALEVKSGQYIRFKAPAFLMESPNIIVEGVLAAKLSTSKPFIWRNGANRLRMYHCSKGFPIISRFEVKGGSSNNTNASIYIDPKDSYWYLEGSGEMTFVEALFIGKI